MNARTLILAILNWQEASGYEIRKMCLEGPFSHFVAISYGSIYPTLAKLEDEGLVISRLERSAGKPDSKVFTITETGRAEFINAMQQPPAKDVFKSEFLLVAMAVEHGTVESITASIESRISYLSEQLAMVRSFKGECEHPGTLWVIGYGEHCINRDLEYLEKNKDQLISLAGLSLVNRAAAE